MLVCDMVSRHYRLMVYIRRPNIQQDTLKHPLSTFTATLWGSVLTIMLPVAVALSVTWYTGPNRDRRSYNMKDCCFYVFGMFCQQGKKIIGTQYNSSSSSSNGSGGSINNISGSTVINKRLPRRCVK